MAKCEGDAVSYTHLDVYKRQDKLHLLVSLEQQGVNTGGLREEYGRDNTFTALVARIVQYLDPKAKSYKRYQTLMTLLQGQTTINYGP